MTTKLEKCNRLVNETFREHLHKDFAAKFDVVLLTTFSLGTMSLVSYLEDDKPFTPEQRDFISAYSDGYVACMNQITDRS